MNRVAMIADGKPIFLQIAELIENEIVDGNLAEEDQIPSTNEFAAFHRINPATAAKGVARLVEDGILYKRRGVGMFVAEGARATLTARRKEMFFTEYVQPLAAEARKLGMTVDHVTNLIARSLTDQPATPERSGTS